MICFKKEEIFCEFVLILMDERPESQALFLKNVGFQPKHICKENEWIKEHKTERRTDDMRSKSRRLVKS